MSQSPHPLPLDAEIITAFNLQITDKLYSEAGWVGGPVEYNGCWREISCIDIDRTSDRIIFVRLEKFPGEIYSLTRWFDAHTLVIVKKR